jgi:hypothetical protein
MDTKYHLAFLWNRNLKFSEHWFNFQIVPHLIYVRSFELIDDQEVIFKKLERELGKYV